MKRVGTDSMVLLRGVCRLLGVQTSYYNDKNLLIRAEPEILKKAIYLVCGYDLDATPSLHACYQDVKAARLRQRLKPAVVAWEGRASRISVTVPAAERESTIRFVIKNSEVRKSWQLGGLRPQRRYVARGEEYYRFDLPLDLKIDYGYHDFTVSFGDVESEGRIISAPFRIGSSGRDSRQWGLFAPLYALRTKTDWGVGGIAELESALKVVRSYGGRYLGLLPLLATGRSQNNYDPSPYSPSSRLFWNEIYLDVEKIISAMGTAGLREVIEEKGFQETLAELRGLDLVDHAGVYAVKKEILNRLSEDFFAKKLDQGEDYRIFMRRNLDVEAYARFMAKDAAESRFHLFVQFQFHLQIEELRTRSRRDEIAGIYLDFPVGVTRNGFDARQFPDVFLPQASIGAPPDSFFEGGQNWMLAPLHPATLHRGHYDYFIKSLRSHLRYASLLRIDHIMGLHHIYIIPDGEGAARGVYIRYDSEPLYAILCLEAFLQDAEIVGEDLGTVSASVRRKMKQHNLNRMWVFEIEFANPPAEAMRGIPAECMASLNTHDMATFSAFWRSDDLCLLQQLKLITANREERIFEDRRVHFKEWLRFVGGDAERKPPPEEVMRALITRMAESRARHLLVAIEDMWSETEPQNVPGAQGPTFWRKKHRLRIDEWQSSPQVLKAVQRIREARQS